MRTAFSDIEIEIDDGDVPRQNVIHIVPKNTSEKILAGPRYGYILESFVCPGFDDVYCCYLDKVYYVLLSQYYTVLSTTPITSERQRAPTT